MYNPTIKLRLTTADRHDIAKNLINKGLAEDCLNNLTENCKMAKMIRETLYKPKEIRESYKVAT